MTILNCLLAPAGDTVELAINSEAVSVEGVKGPTPLPKFRHNTSINMLMAASGDVRPLDVVEHGIRLGVEAGETASDVFAQMPEWLPALWKELSASPTTAPASPEFVLTLAAPVAGRLRAVAYQITATGFNVIELAPGQCVQMPGTLPELRGAEPGCRDGVRMLATLQRRFAPAHEGPTFPVAGDLAAVTLTADGLTVETVPEAAWA